MINIAERPAEADDRAVPGHWEGDLIIGKRNAYGDRHPGRTHHRLHDAGCAARRLQARAGRDALAAKITDAARDAAPLADLGPGPGDARLEAGPASTPTSTIFFCDPHAPWQRGTNENTNGLLRQYFPKGTDLSRTPSADARRRRRRTQRPTTQAPRLRQPDRTARTAAVAMTARIRRSPHGCPLSHGCGRPQPFRTGARSGRRAVARSARPVPASCIGRAWARRPQPRRVPTQGSAFAIAPGRNSQHGRNSARRPPATLPRSRAGRHDQPDRSRERRALSRESLSVAATRTLGLTFGPGALRDELAAGVVPRSLPLLDGISVPSTGRSGVGMVAGWRV